MPEVAYTGKHHCHAMLVSSGDHFLIPDTATGLNNRSGASFGDNVDAVPKREECIRRNN